MAQTVDLPTDRDEAVSTTIVTASPPGEAEPAATPFPTSDFEQRRVIDSVRGKLFKNRRVEVRIGRYRVEKRLGAGGMGEVYLAVDEALDRRIAIKRVRSDIDRPAEHERLRLEARALARLSHSNVVQIYEVGEHEDQIYLAMEFIEGTTLSGWLSETRGWREILTTFVAAGRGLAAAHSAGVVHRDFKPDNVLIGRDGRVCVADFGLALAHASREGGALVRPREIAGTIRYMSLEQIKGEAIDARTDQFAFCTALAEALWGQSPFDPRIVTKRLLELEDDRPVTPKRRGVPQGLWPIVRRGLHRDPERRWPDFESLLAALEALPRRRARRAWAAAVTPIVATVGFVFSQAGMPRDACAAVPEELAGVWDETVEQELVEAFAASGVPHARASAERAVASLDDWADDWTQQRTAQCRAADEPELARARRSCLEEQREMVAVMTTTLRGGELDVIDRAIEALAGLPEPSECAVAELLEGPPLPSSTIADEVEGLRLALAEQRSLRLLGRLDVEPAVHLSQEANALDYLPVRAEALAERGHAELDGGDPRVGLDHLDEAAQLAITADHPRLLAQTWTDAALAALTRIHEPTWANDRLDLAEAAWGRLTPDASTEARLRFGRARVALAEGRREQAIALYREALELHGEHDSATLPNLLDGLADAVEPSDPDEALELRERELAVAERVFGGEHPETAGALYDLGSTLALRGESDRAKVYFERAIAIWIHAHGEPHPDLARAHLLIANQALVDGDLERAETHALALMSIHDATLPVDHADRGDATMLLGRIAALRGDRAEALQHFRATFRVWEREAELGTNHMVELRLDIAGNELGLGELAAAEADYRAVLESTNNPTLVGLGQLGLAELALRRGELDAARVQLEAVDLASLGEHEVTHVVLDFLVDARSGCRACVEGVEERLATAMREHGWTSELLAPWLVELGMTKAEWAGLGLPVSAIEPAIVLD